MAFYFVVLGEKRLLVTPLLPNEIIIILCMYRLNVCYFCIRVVFFMFGLLIWKPVMKTKPRITAISRRWETLFTIARLFCYIHIRIYCKWNICGEAVYSLSQSDLQHEKSLLCNWMVTCTRKCDRCVRVRVSVLFVFIIHHFKND